MVHNFYRTGWLLALLSLPIAAFGQGCCSGGTPTSGSFSIQALKAKEGSIMLYTNYNRMDQLYGQSLGAIDSKLFRSTSSSLLQGAYGISDRFAINLTVPFIQQTLGHVTDDESRQQTQGIGDLVLGTQYLAAQFGDHSIYVGAGVKFPTGQTQHQLPDTQIFLAPDLQSGTGSWDGLVGFQHNWVHAGLPGATLSLRGVYKFPGGSRRFGGQQHYRFGHEWQAALSWSKQLYLKGIWEPAITFLYRQTTADMLEGIPVPNTGGHWLFLRPTITFFPNPNFNLQIGGQAPILKGVSGLQFITRYSLTLSIQFLLRSKNPTLDLSTIHRGYQYPNYIK